MGMLPRLFGSGRRGREFDAAGEPPPGPTFDGTFEAAIQLAFGTLAASSADQAHVAKLPVLRITAFEDAAQLDDGERRKVEAIFGDGGQQPRHQ